MHALSLCILNCHFDEKKEKGFLLACILPAGKQLMMIE
jgi:hypothetical protein